MDINFAILVGSVLHFGRINVRKKVKLNVHSTLVWLPNIKFKFLTDSNAAALCTNRFVHKCMDDKPCFRQWGCSDLRDVRILRKKGLFYTFKNNYLLTSKNYIHLNFEASISIFENLNQVKMKPQLYWRDIKNKNLKWINFEIFH